MANLPKFTTDVNNIQALSDRPNEQDGLSSAELKAKFDKAVSDIKDYINNTLTTTLDSSLTEIDGEISEITGETVETLFDTYMASVRAEEYPVGRIVMFYDNADHSNYLGYTWVRTCVGRVPVGIDSTQTEFNTLGKTGGEKTHKLTINEMPSHTHTANRLVFLSAENVREVAGITAGPAFTPQGMGRAADINNYTGGSQPHNVIQPYEVISFWKRVS